MQGKIKCNYPNKSQCLLSRDYKGFGNQVMTGVETSNKKIRQMYPIEYERLQNIPDNYTNILSKTQRYKCLGNAWTVNIISHIFKFMEIL